MKSYLQLDLKTALFIYIKSVLIKIQIKKQNFYIHIKNILQMF